MQIKFSQKINLGVFLLVIGMMSCVIWVTDHAAVRAIRHGVQQDILAAEKVLEVFQIYHQFRIVLLIIFCMILIAALFLGMVFSRRVTKPIQALMQGAKRIATGDFSEEVKVTTHDEIAELSRTFNQMMHDLKKFKEDLIVSKEFTDDIIRSMLDILIVTDDEEKIQRINPAALKLLGYRENELIGKPISVILRYQSFQEKGGIEEVIKKGFIRNQEEVYLTKSGQGIPVSLSVSVLYGTDRQVRGLVLNAMDMSERKELEERTLQSEKMATVGQMAGGIAHEINNPIGVILGFSEILVRRMKAGNPHESHIKAIYREAKRCKEIVHDLLIFSRSGKPTQELLDVNLSVEAAVILVITQAKVLGHRIEFHLEPGLPKVLINPTQIQQVIINLCNNAMDAMDKGGWIRIRTSKGTLYKKSGVEISVQDTGFGMEPEALNRIFDPFFTTKEEGKGTGLGLSLVYQIIRKHEGDIKVESRPGKGTVFRIWLPVPRETEVN